MSSGSPYSVDALELYRDLLGPDHPEIAANLANLARFYEEKRLYKKAENLLEQAIAILEKTDPPQPLMPTTIQSELAHCYWQQGKFVEAEQILRESLPQIEHFTGTGTQHLAASLV